MANKQSPKKLKTETLIIGAGPAGLAAAMELSRAKKDFIIIEKQDRVGGLAKTYTFKEADGSVFLTDNGPHRFFSKNPYLYSFIEDLLDEKWISVRRQTRQFIDGKFYDYPVNAPQALKNMGILKSIHIGFDYLIAKIQYGVFKKKIVSFDDYVVANFGRTLANFNMINYTEKIWGIPATTIHPDWAGQRIKGLSLTSLVADSARRLLKANSKTDKPKSLVSTFYFPEFGTGLIYEAIVKRITKVGYKLLLNTEPTSIVRDGDRITQVKAMGPDGEIMIECQNVVESVPLTSFIKLFEPKAPAAILKAGKSLRHRNQKYIFITLDKASITDDQWIYFPSKETPIARVSEMRNFSDKMSPKGKTSMFVEFFCFEGDEIWKMSDKKLYEITISYFEKIGFFTRQEVRKYYVFKQRDVYPVYDLSYQTYLEEIKGFMDSIENLYYIGRPGRFRYNNQDHSLEMGIAAAKSIITGKRQDIEKIGSEKDYYEAGNLEAAKAKKKS